MRLKGRLDKLEPQAVTQWRKAWESFAVKSTESTQHLSLDENAVELCTEGEHPFREAHPELEPLLRWCRTWTTPDPDTHPDLQSWPHTIPAPPHEPLGIREKLEPYLSNPDPALRTLALVTIIILEEARLVREYRVSLKRSLARR